MPPLFLGLDASTQSLTAVLIDPDRGTVVHRASLAFDALPGHGAARGVLPDPDPMVAHAPPRMWAEALDLLLGRMKAEGVPLEEIAAVSGSGQQHGSVYLRPGFASRLAGLDPGRPLAEQLESAFSRPTSPIWMDTSTSQECLEIGRSLGGPARVAALTGSAPTERFTGPQIRAFWKRDPAGYARTGRIHLVSSFMASLLGGVDAPIDPGDGAGMNLMDLARGTWHADCLEATAPDLAERLPNLAPSWTVTGRVAPYWTRRHGLNADALNVAWSGDNPCSILGLGILAPGEMALSLGTSDTLLGALSRPLTAPRGEGHVFGHPAGRLAGGASETERAGGPSLPGAAWMSLICFRNGSLARERVRDACGLDWAGFAAALEASQPGNGGGLMLPWFEPEIVPRVSRAGVQTRGIAAGDQAALVRGVVEGQMLAMRLHSAWMGEAPTRILATGGGSANDGLLQIMADVHQAEVRRMEAGDSAALGAALGAAHAWMEMRSPADWASLVAPFTRPEPACFRPRQGTAELYGRMLREYQRFETEALAALEAIEP